MSQITAYTWTADYHCIECTRDEFTPTRSDAYDANGVPLDATDGEGNPAHPVFSTDELPTVLVDTFGDDLRWYEPQEFFTCGTCRQQFSFLTGDLKCI